MLSLNYLNYILIAAFVVAICESQQLELAEVAVERLDCRENTCQGLDFPNISEVAFIQDKVKENLANYESLIVHSSRLANLPRNIFHNLPQLVELDILECELQQLERKCFEGAGNLLRLNLGGNSINQLDTNVFELTTQLEELNLSDNQLEELPTRILLPLKNLKKINFSNNQLKTISPSIFLQLTSLKSVNLDSNQLKALPGDLFRDQRKHLSEFSARNNHLDRFPSNIFASVNRLLLSGNFQLKRLQLAANIDHIQVTNSGLESVKLNGHVINVQLEDNLNLSELKISQPQDLEQLYLANTNLTRLDFLSKASKLVDLDVTGIENLSELPEIVSAKGLERLSFTYDNVTSENMEMLPELTNLNILEISHEKGKEVFIKDLEDDFFVDHAEVNCGQLADLLEFIDLPKDTTILEDRVVGDPRGPLRCGAA